MEGPGGTQGRSPHKPTCGKIAAQRAFPIEPKSQHGARQSFLLSRQSTAHATNAATQISFKPYCDFRTPQAFPVCLRCQNLDFLKLRGSLLGF